MKHLEKSSLSFAKFGRRYKPIDANWTQNIVIFILSYIKVKLLNTKDNENVFWKEPWSNNIIRKHGGQKEVVCDILVSRRK